MDEKVHPARADERVDGGQRAVQSVEVGGRLLLALGATPGPMALKDLAAQAGLTPSRAHPYLVSFAKLGFVEQVRETGRYALGPSALQLGLNCLHQLDPIRAAEPVAQSLADATGFGVALALWGNLGPTIVRMIEARQPLLVSMRAGTVMSSLHSATGRAFAARMPLERIEHAVSGALGDARRQPHPLSRDDREIVAQARADVAAHGVVRAQGRPIPGVNAFAAAALDHAGQPAIVITALGHQDHFPSDWRSPAARSVRESAAAISRRLGWKADRA